MQVTSSHWHKTMTLSELIVGQPGTDQEVLDWCNTPSVTRLREYMSTERTLMADLGPVMADAILTKLEAVPDSVVQRVVKMLSPSQGGIDLGHPATRAQIDALVVGGVLLSEEGDALKGLGEEVVSPAVNAGFGVIRFGEIVDGRAG